MLPQLLNAQYNQNSEDFQFWVDIAKRKDSPSLELGCGTGRVLAAIAMDKNDIVWFRTGGSGAASFDGNNWIVYDRGLHNKIYVEHENVKWFGYGNIISSYDGNEWEEYKITDSGISNEFAYIHVIAVDKNFGKRLGTYGCVAVLYGGKDYIVNENQGWDSSSCSLSNIKD